MYMYNRDLNEKFNYKRTAIYVNFLFNSMFMLLYNNFYKIFNLKKI